ncbi:Uncharacterized protein LSUB1_G005960 [Lachnellula subtilissima]|uniref:CHY-type domain-containing protein n=1 Tax=Lachnellula subtilissima TaxID=602034 RepID=A0A8H8RGI5_9HELO|nr:Uncharacterized protein LSUB1_G005960 [Lachnellula subtilissima]
MCKHILNAQVSIRAPCCRKWFDCAECHLESEDHPLLQRTEMVRLFPSIPIVCLPRLFAINRDYQVFACKKCKKAFRKDGLEFEESDEYCPHCDNHFVLEAVTAKPILEFEGEDARVDSRMLKDDRVRGEEQRTIFDVKEAPNKLG